MIQIPQKWEVCVRIRNQGEPIRFYISDQFLQNILRKVSDLEFSDAWEITVRAIEVIHAQTGTQHEYDTNYEAAMEALRKRPSDKELLEGGMKSIVR